MGACLSDRSMINPSLSNKEEQQHRIKNQRTLSSQSATTKSCNTPMSPADAGSIKDFQSRKSTDIELSASTPDTPIITCITSIVHREPGDQREDMEHALQMRLASAIQECAQQQLIKYMNEMDAQKQSQDSVHVFAQNIIACKQSQDSIVSMIGNTMSGKLNVEDDENTAPEDNDEVEALHKTPSSSSATTADGIKCHDAVNVKAASVRARQLPPHQNLSCLASKSVGYMSYKNDSLPNLRDKVLRYNVDEGTKYKCQPATHVHDDKTESSSSDEDVDEEEVSDSDQFIKGGGSSKAMEMSMDTLTKSKVPPPKAKKVSVRACALKYKSLSIEQSGSTELKDVPNSPVSESYFESITKLTEMAHIDGNADDGLHSPGNETMVKKPSITMSQLSTAHHMGPGAASTKHKGHRDCTVVTPSDCTVTPLSRSRLSARFSLKFNLVPIPSKPATWKYQRSYDGIDHSFYYTDDEELEDGEDDDEHEQIPHIRPQLLLPPVTTTASHEEHNSAEIQTGNELSDESMQDLECKLADQEEEDDEEEDVSISCSYQFYQSFKRESIERAVGRNLTHMIHKNARKNQQPQQLQVHGIDAYLNDITVQTSAQSSTMETIYDEDPDHVTTTTSIPHIGQQTSSDKIAPYFATTTRIKMTPDSLVTATLPLPLKSATCTPSHGNMADISKSDINYSMKPQLSAHSLSFDGTEHEGHPSPMTPITPFTPYMAISNTNNNMNVCYVPPIISDPPPPSTTMLTAPTMSNDDLFLSELEQTPSVTLPHEGIYQQYTNLQRRPGPPAHAFNYYINHKSDFDDEHQLPIPLSPSNQTDATPRSTRV